jgi:hypothetical protein
VDDAPDSAPAYFTGFASATPNLVTGFASRAHEHAVTEPTT